MTAIMKFGHSSNINCRKNKLLIEATKSNLKSSKMMTEYTLDWPEEKSDNEGCYV